MANIIQPFSLISEEESEILMKQIMEDKAKVKRKSKINTIESNGGVIVAAHDRFKIENKQNPFLNACKKVFGFIKDNVNVDVNLNPDLASSNGVVAQPTDRLASIFKPKVTISAGPLEVELNSDILRKPLDKIRTY